MSSLIFVGIFVLRDGRTVTSSFTKRSGEKGTVTHALYTTSVVCCLPPDLPAELQMYYCATDSLYADRTVALVITKGYVPPGDVAGDLLLDAIHIAPLPANSDLNDEDFPQTLPNFEWPLIFAFGSVSGTSTTLPKGQVSFPVSASEFVHSSTKSMTLLCALFYFCSVTA